MRLEVFCHRHRLLHAASVRASDTTWWTR